MADPYSNATYGGLNLGSILQRRAQEAALRNPRMARPQAGINLTPDVSGDFDPSAANDILAPYGLQEPSHINPFIMFNDQQGLGANHPRIAGAIEGALLGAQVPSGDTVGENIGNVARTVMGIPDVYRQNAMNQFMAPFQMAAPMAQLQGLQAQTDMAKAHTLYFNAEAKKAELIKALPDFKDTKVVRNPITGTTELWGTNSLTGQYSMVPGSDKANLPDPTEGKDPQGDPYINAAIGPKPIRSATDTDEQFNAKMAVWGKKATDLKTQMATDPRVAAALARPVTVIQGGVPTTVSGGTAIHSGAPLAGPLNTDKVIGQQSILSELHTNLNNIKNNLGALPQNGLDTMTIAAGMTNPDSSIGQWAKGQALSGASQKQLDLMNSVRTAREGVTAFRVFLANSPLRSDTQLSLMLSQIPDTADLLSGSPKVVSAKIANFEKSLGAVEVRYKALAAKTGMGDPTIPAATSAPEDNSGMLTGPQTPNVRRYNPVTKKFE